jgi:hypothetical protein
MLSALKPAGVFAVLSAAAVVATTDTAPAVTADVAKKCAALTARAYPPRVPGNPAAGSIRGTGLAEQDYFRRCVANGGNVDGDAH